MQPINHRPPHVVNQKFANLPGHKFAVLTALLVLGTVSYRSIIHCCLLNLIFTRLNDSMMCWKSMTGWLVLAALTLSSRAAVIDAHGAPPRLIENVESNFKIRKGESSFRLTCPVQPADKEMLMIEWMKDNDQIDWDSRYRMSKDNRELKIKGVRLEDSGTYRCHATNGFGHRSFNFSVHVYDPTDIGATVKDKIVLADSPAAPEFLIDMVQEASPPIKVNRGGRIELRCPSRGNPIPEIRWYHDNMLLNTNSPLHIASLVIDPATEGHSGNYRCVVENRLGSIDAVFNVFVDDFFDYRRPPTEAIGIEPIIDLPYNISVKVGHTAQFQCKARNAGNAMMIKWLKEISDPITVKRQDPNATIISTNGTHLLVLDQTQVETVTRDGNHNVYANRLVLASVTEAAAGRYICVVTSSQGQIVHKSAQLTVIPDTTNFNIPKEFKMVLIVLLLVLFFCIVGCAILFLKRSQEPTSPKMVKPPPPPRIPPPMAPSSSYTPTLNRSFNRDMDKTCSPMILKNSMFAGKPMAKTLDRQYLKGNRGFDEMSHVYDCGSPQPYISTPTRNHPVYIPPSSQAYRTLEMYGGRAHPSLYSDDYTEQKPFIDYRR